MFQTFKGQCTSDFILRCNISPTKLVLVWVLWLWIIYFYFLHLRLQEISAVGILRIWLLGFWGIRLLGEWVIGVLGDGRVGDWESEGLRHIESYFGLVIKGLGNWGIFWLEDLCIRGLCNRGIGLLGDLVNLTQIGQRYLKNQVQNCIIFSFPEPLKPSKHNPQGIVFT